MENMNDTAVSEMKTLFTKEIEGKIEDEEERLSELQLTAEQLTLSFYDTDQKVSQLKQTVDGISLSVTDQNGVVSSVDLASGTLDLKNLVFSVLQENGATVINGGNIKTGMISAVDIQGVSISGSEITGSTLTSVSAISQVRIDNGRVAFYDPVGDLLCGSLRYDGYGRLLLASLSEVVLSIESSHNLSIDAKDGKTIYLGSAAGTTQKIEVGSSGSTISLHGTVMVNGNVIS
ncbi:MAG: hypothetical protein ACI3W6_07360 [Clostridia bacterium]